jgi:hypothetical protein
MGYPSAEGAHQVVVVLVIPVLVAVVEVLDPRVAGVGVLRTIVLSTSPSRILGRVTARDAAGQLPAVSLLRLAVAS